VVAVEVEAGAGVVGALIGEVVPLEDGRPAGHVRVAHLDDVPGGGDSAARGVVADRDAALRPSDVDAVEGGAVAVELGELDGVAVDGSVAVVDPDAGHD